MTTPSSTTTDLRTDRADDRGVIMIMMDDETDTDEMVLVDIGKCCQEQTSALQQGILSRSSPPSHQTCKMEIIQMNSSPPVQEDKEIGTHQKSVPLLKS